MITKKEIKEIKHEIAKLLGTQDEVVDYIQKEANDPGVIILAKAVQERMDKLRLQLLEIEGGEDRAS